MDKTDSHTHRCTHAPESPVDRRQLTAIHRAHRQELLTQIAHYRASALDVLRAQHDSPDTPVFVAVDPRMLLALCECADIVQGLVYTTLAADPVAGPPSETPTGGAVLATGHPGVDGLHPSLGCSRMAPDGDPHGAASLSKE